MCNCGNKRENITQQSSSLSNIPKSDIQKKMWQDVEFEYTGSTALTVTGNITGNTYRFYHPNNIQKIDYRDAAGMMGVPVLKKVKRDS
jgi:hypothetical protein